MLPGLYEGLQHYLSQGLRSFHTPGHKGNREFFLGMRFPEGDLTELPGLDMLHSPTGIIAWSQARAAEIYGAQASFFLVNGGTVGNQAMFLALGQAQGEVIVERQAHRSVMSALVLTGLTPRYLPATIHPEFNLPLGLDLKHTATCLGNALAWHFTYPSYYGSLIDLTQILGIRERDFPGLPVFVDQAHGAHYLHDLFPPGALAMGADAVLQSPHKTLSALTQAGMLHVQGQRLARHSLQQALELLQSSSPSYLLMASLERALEFAQDRKRWAGLEEEVARLHRDTEGLRLLNREDEGRYGIWRVDWSKILVNTSSLGISAPECVEWLRRDEGIEPELWDGDNILFMLGIGNTAEDVRSLNQALQRLRDGHKGSVRRKRKWPRLELPPQPPLRRTPREVFFGRKRRSTLRDSLGQVAAESISPYPPGIPIIVMGEVITPEVLETLQNSGVQWQGWEGYADQWIWVLDEG